MLTLFEWSTGMFMQKKLSSKKPEVVEKAVIALLRPFRQDVLTITTDNGMEFRNHEAIGKSLGCTVCFADPFCYGKKGGVENINRIFREYYPKGTDFRLMDQRELDLTQYQIKERPRKKPDFSTPKVEFLQKDSLILHLPVDSTLMFF